MNRKSYAREPTPRTGDHVTHEIDDLPLHVATTGLDAFLIHEQFDDYTTRFLHQGKPCL